MNQQNTGSEERKSEGRERQVEKDEDGIVFDRDALMERLADVLKNCRSRKLSRRPSKLADKTRKQRKGKTWTDATGSKTFLRAPRIRRAWGLAEAVKRLAPRRKAGSNAITEQAEEEAKGIVACAKNSVCNDNAVCAERKSRNQQDDD